MEEFRFFQSMEKSAEDNGGIHEVKELRKYETATYVLDTSYSFTYSEEMLELAEEEEEKTEKKTKDLKDFFDVLVLKSQLEIIMKRLDELMKSYEEE